MTIGFVPFLLPKPDNLEARATARFTYPHFIPEDFLPALTARAVLVANPMPAFIVGRLPACP